MSDEKASMQQAKMSANAKMEIGQKALNTINNVA